MRGALLIVKKEFLELAKDRKTMFFTFALPFILYPLLFLMLGKMVKSDSAQRQGKASRVYMVDPSGALTPLMKENAKLELVGKPEGDVKQALRDQKLEMMVEVDPLATDRLQKHETFSVKAMVDQSDASGRLALNRMEKALRTQNEKWVVARLESINASKQLAAPTKLEQQDAGDQGLAQAKLLGTILPYMIMLMMFAGSMPHGIYVTAGEKERGTLQSLLATSLPRTQIIIGKLLYIFCIGVISAVLNLLSMTFSMSQMFSGMSQGSQAVAAGTATAAPSTLSAIANPMILLGALALMIPLGLLFANIILLGGIHAKNSQEAGTGMMPALILVIFMGVFSTAPGI